MNVHPSVHPSIKFQFVEHLNCQKSIGRTDETMANALLDGGN